MIKIANRVTPALSRNDLSGAYNRARPALQRDTLLRAKFGVSTEAVKAQPARKVSPVHVQEPQINVKGSATMKDMPVPRLEHNLIKGQKTMLDLRESPLGRLRISFGWNIRDPRCDVDASAFMVDASGRVINDSWFVFYGQPVSPDGSLSLSDGSCEERASFIFKLDRLDKRITKIVLIVSINEALKRGLNFSMLKDAYVRITDDASGRELVSYELNEYYSNVTSMTFGELYLHNGQWKFNPIGNGVQMDLAGQCAVYGVKIR